MRPLIIRGVTLFDGAGAAPVAGMAVVVEGERIGWIGPVGQLPAETGAVVVEGNGRTLLPGLIDCHVHLTMDAAADVTAQATRDSAATAALRAANNCRLHIRNGVTTVRDLGAASNVALDVMRAIESGLIAGPRVQAAGRVVTMTGGHGHFIGRQADGPDECRKAARAELLEGASCVKVMSTGGVLTPGVRPGQTAYTVEELRAVVEEAHKAGRRAASHTIGYEGTKNVLRAGIDSVEHGTFIDDEAVELFLETGAYLVPTLLAIPQIVDNAAEAGIPDWVAQKARGVAQDHLRSFERAAIAGVRIAAGTDAGTPCNTHGDLWRELVLMSQHGLTPTQALVAATREAARNLGLADQIGTVETGKLADLILVDGDPLADLTALSRVSFVLKGGTILKSTSPAGAALVSA